MSLWLILILSLLNNKLMPLNWYGEIEIRSSIDSNIINNWVARYRQLAQHHLTEFRLNSLQNMIQYGSNRSDANNQNQKIIEINPDII